MKSITGWSMQREIHGKVFYVYGCKQMRESPQVRLRTYCAMVCLLRGSVCVALWLESWPAELEHLPVAGLFPRLWAGSHRTGLQCLSTALDPFDCSVPAPLHMGIPWKRKLILKHSGKLPRHCGYIVKLVLYFPGSMGEDYNCCSLLLVRDLER